MQSVRGYLADSIPVAVSGTVGVVIPCGPSPHSRFASAASAQLPPLCSAPVTGVSSLIWRAPTPPSAVVAFPILVRLRHPLGPAPHAGRSPELPWSPFPTCHLRRHRRNVEQTATVELFAPDSLRQMHRGSAFRFYSFRCSLDGVHFSLWPVGSEDAPLAASASRPHSGHLFRS